MTRHIALVLIFCIFPFLASAQQDGSITILDLGAMELGLSGDKRSNPIETLGRIRNSEMKNVLLLQNEISMLNALKDWEQQVSELRTLYMKSGRSFSSPLPPKDICEQVPANSVCGAAYPEMAPVVKIEPLPVSSVLSAEPKPIEQKEQVIQSASLAWDSIRCVSQKCTAILVDEDTNARVTAMPGEMIDDRIMVQDISAQGVTILIDGEPKKLRPTPKKDAAENPRPVEQNNLASSLENLPPATLPLEVDPQENADALEPIVLDDGSGQANAPDPSGLF